MANTLIDAGPLIALFDRDDRFHKSVSQFFRTYKGRLLSTWPVLTETAHMLDFRIDVQTDFLKWIQRGAVEIAHLDRTHLNRIIELTETYANVPMDLADASLMVIAEQLNIREIITIDSDYAVYRTGNNEYLNNLLAPYL